MYFYMQKGKQVLDLRGDFILTHNKNLVVSRVKSAAPAAVHNATRSDNIPGMTFGQKVRLLFMVRRFIFSKSLAIAPKDIEEQIAQEELTKSADNRNKYPH